MKLRKDKKIVRFSGIAGVLVLMGLFITIFFPDPAYLLAGSSLIMMGLLMFIIVIYAATRTREQLIVDERIQRVYEKAGYHAFTVLNLAIACVFLMDLYFSINFRVRDITPVLYLIGIWSWIIFRWHYGKKGEV